MNSIAWFSRLAIWIAAAVILVEAVSGRSVGVLTLLSICVMAAALIAFLATLTEWPQRLVAVTAGASESPSMPATITATPPEVQVQTPAIEPVHQHGESEVALVPEASAPPQAIPVAIQADAPTPRPGRVAVNVVREHSPYVGSVCLRCQQPLSVGQLAATCPECGVPHHATCWIENRFHCSREGCSGHGSLEEPAD